MVSRKLILLGVFISVLLFAPMVYQSYDLDLSSNYQSNSAQTFTGAKILFDEAHTKNGSALWTPGNASLFSALLTENGHESDTNFENDLDSTLLSNYDILVLFFPQISLKSSEVTAIEDFVENGGGLLLVGIDNQTTSWLYTPEHLNSISESFGITFNLDEWSGTANDFDDHQVMQGVSSIHSNSEQHSACSLSLSGSATSVALYDGNSIVAVSSSGSGRVVAVGTLAPFLMYNEKVNLLESRYDHHQFSLNVIDWLSGNAHRTATIPERNVLYVGDGPNLTPAQIAEYKIFTGVYHEHTTHSDGAQDPDEVLDTAMDISLDFMIPTDHSYDVEPTNQRGGITGAMAMREIAKRNGLDIHIVLGAELSKGKHSVAFPLTENVYTNIQQEMITESHNQGAIIGLCHPTIDPTYAPVYEEFESYDYDFIEVDNSGFIYGSGEEGFSKNFMGASDFHDRWKMNTMLNVLFIQNPTGPDGSISDADIVDAVLNRRIVIIDKINSIVYGEKVWVDRFLEMEEETETSISTATTIIQQEEATGTSVGLSRLYLRWAESAFDYMSYGKSLRYSNNSISPDSIGIDIEIASPEEFVFEENSAFDVTIDITNNLDYEISINTSLIKATHLDISPINQEQSIPDGSSVSFTRPAQLTEPGFVNILINILDFDTNDDLMPVILRMGGIVDVINFDEELDETGTTVQVWVPTQRDDYGQIKSATLTYTDSSGQEYSVAMSPRIDGVRGEITDYYAGETLDLSIEIVDYAGETYTLTGTYTVQEGAPPLPLMPIIAVIGIAGVAAVVIVIAFRKFKGT
ncbi:MAG: hypothetical protein BAJATHORv1_10276 [Candidatus Thorarchaeota archaeon]|nr:MAG: hypothetical protein BAJATHORv1_10276 [Candidatus Thorarchaeota archaeon]